MNIPAASHMCARMGWQAAFVATDGDSSNRGGVAIICREPFAMVEVSKSSSSCGQTLHTILHGGQRSLNVICLYRHHSDTQFTVVHEVAVALNASKTEDWLVAMDGNENQEAGTCCDVMGGLSGVRCAVARHTKSQHPIDAIWASSSLPPVGPSQELEGDGDHTVAAAIIDLNFQHGGPQHRLTTTRRIVSAPCLEPSVSPTQSWASIACSDSMWLHALKDVNQAWETWCSEVERWLLQAGIVEDKKPQRELGSLPTTRVASHRCAPNQPLPERQLRRYLRRLREAHYLTRCGKRVNYNLLVSLNNTAAMASCEERSAVNHRQWGRAIALATTRLEQLQSESRKERLRKWQHQMHDVSSACKWIRQEEAIPYAIQELNGEVLTSRSRAVNALQKHWRKIFGTPAEAANVEHFFETFHDEMPCSEAMPKLPRITSADLRKAAQRMQSKVAGLDGVDPKWLVKLPQAALERLADFLNLCEAHENWPPPLRQWKVVCIPKKRAGFLPTVDEIRPISVGSVIYRIWGQVRLRQVAAKLAQFLDSKQSGGVGGADVSSLLLSLDIDLDCESFPCLLALDYAKAFDSLDYTICVELLRKLGLPRQIWKMLQAQWSDHERWMSFGQEVCCEPIRGALGLAQGDPWSPICLSLVLLLAKKRQLKLVPQSECVLYLDDRTLLAKNPLDLQAALQSWDVLHTVTRLKTNNKKTQVCGRTYPALLDLQEAGWSPKTTAEVLGVTVGILPRPESESEKLRAQKCKALAQRISVLPVSQSFKATLASLVMASKACWGPLLNGRAPTQMESDAYAQNFRAAVKGRYGKGVASRNLEKVLLLGHTSDLPFFSCQKTLVSLTKWRQANPGNWSQRKSPVVEAISKVLAKLNIDSVSWGCWEWGGGRWDTNSPCPLIPRLSHELRQAWRKWHFQEWLQSDRNDARIARQEQTVITERLIDSLRKKARKAQSNGNGHELAVITGGLKPDAKSSTPPTFCADCQTQVCPSTYHVLHECSGFRSIRFLPPTACPLLNRLGWNGQGVDSPRINQHAKVRAELCKSQAARRYARPSPAVLGLAGAAGGEVDEGSALPT